MSDDEDVMDMLGKYNHEVFGVNALTYDSVVKVLTADLMPAILNAKIPDEKKVKKFKLGMKVAGEAKKAEPDRKWLNTKKEFLQTQVDEGKGGADIVGINKLIIEALDALIAVLDGNPDATGTVKVRCDSCKYEMEVPKTASVFMLDCEKCGEEGSYRKVNPILDPYLN